MSECQYIGLHILAGPRGHGTDRVAGNRLLLLLYDHYNKYNISDCVLLSRSLSQDLDGFLQYLTSQGNTICGRNPILVLLGLLRGTAMADQRACRAK